MKSIIFILPLTPLLQTDTDTDIDSSWMYVNSTQQVLLLHRLSYQVLEVKLIWQHCHNIVTTTVIGVLTGWQSNRASTEPIYDFTMYHWDKSWLSYKYFILFLDRSSISWYSMIYWVLIGQTRMVMYSCEHQFFNFHLTIIPC